MKLNAKGMFFLLGNMGWKIDGVGWDWRKWVEEDIFFVEVG